VISYALYKLPFECVILFAKESVQNVENIQEVEPQL